MSKYVCKNCSCDLPYGPHVTPERIEELERRLKIMREWMVQNGQMDSTCGVRSYWRDFIQGQRDAADWFDEDGVPIPLSDSDSNSR